LRLRRHHTAGPVALAVDERAELDAYRAALSVLVETCERLSRGDLEARVPPMPGPDQLDAVRWSINHLVDASPTRSSGSPGRP